MTTRPASRDDGPSRKGVFAVSVAIHVILLGVFPFLVASFRGDAEPEPIDIVFYPREVAPRELPEIDPEPAPPLEPEPAKPVIAKAEVPRPPKRERPEPSRPEPRVENAPRVATLQPQAVRLPDPTPDPPAPKPVRKRQVVKTEVFQQPSMAEAPRTAARVVTRDAGFAAEGEPARTAPASQLRASPRVGGFEVDPAPAGEESPPADRRRVVSASSFGDDGAPAASTPKARSRTTVQTAGFTGEVAEAPARRTGGAPSAVNTGGFGDDEPVARPRATRKKSAENPDTPVEIVSKPKPLYTPEARELKVEGEVVLDVVFVADGTMRIVGVVEGLGHGLDEAATTAARKIEFEPARRNGQPVDHAARLRIVFQLA